MLFLINVLVDPYCITEHIFYIKTRPTVVPCTHCTYTHNHVDRVLCVKLTGFEDDPWLDHKKQRIKGDDGHSAAL